MTKSYGSQDNTSEGIIPSSIPQFAKFSEAKKNIEFRFKSLNSIEKTTLTELVESGSQFFVDYLINKGDMQLAKEKFNIIGEQLIKANKFIEKYNYLLSFGLGNQKKNDEKSIIQSVNNEAHNIIDKPLRVNLWIKDNLNNEIWTYLGDKRVQFESNTDIMG